MNFQASESVLEAKKKGLRILTSKKPIRIMVTKAEIRKLHILASTYKRTSSCSRVLHHLCTSFAQLTELWINHRVSSPSWNLTARLGCNAEVLFMEFTCASKRVWSPQTKLSIRDYDWKNKRHLCKWLMFEPGLSWTQVLCFGWEFHGIQATQCAGRWFIKYNEN